MLTIFKTLARRSAIGLLGAVALWSAAGSAQAVPSFARQTGLACSGCHVGGFGPQLTDIGVQFKLGGYTMSKPDAPKLPVAGMVMASFTRTQHDVPSSEEHVKDNNNLNLDQQVSLFLAGKLADDLGIFSQLTYEGIGRVTAIDNVDLRFAHTFGNSLLAGVSINNNPGLSDPYNTLPAWGAPFISSGIAPAPGTGTLLDETLAQRVIGATAYAQLHGIWYGELGTYRSLSSPAQYKLGLGQDANRLHSNLYLRLAAQQTWGEHSLAGGATAFNATLQPDRSAPEQQKYKDLALDASYRWTMSNDRIFTVLASATREKQSGDLGDDTIHEHSVTAAYYWAHYGSSLQKFGVRSQATGDDSSGVRLQLDWTPAGKAPLNGTCLEPQWRYGAQYTRYSKFDGDTDTAKGNNSLYLFAWLLF